MKQFLLVLFIASFSVETSVIADETKLILAQRPVTMKQDSSPWLGLQIKPLDQATRVHAKIIPQGVGFLVTLVEDDSPAMKAGLSQYDIVWKLNDQLLINEAQFGTLIQMHEPGDTVQFTVVRSGEPKTVDLVLASAQDRPVANEPSPTEIALFRRGIPGMPRQIVYPEEGAAEITREDGATVRLTYEGNDPYVTILNKDTEIVFDGQLVQNGRWAVPAEWNPSVGALMRAINRTRDSQWPTRTPRPRVVLPSNSPPNASK